MSISPTVLLYTYCITAACFILGVRYLGSPATARRGNILAAAGMALALVISTIALSSTLPWGIVIPAVILGGLIGAVSAKLVRMTAMPQMVALFNGMGAGTATLIGVIHILTTVEGHPLNVGDMLSTALGAGIGSLSFTGSIIAYAKLQELIKGRPITFPLQKPFNGVLLLIIIVLGILTGTSTASPDHALFIAMVGVALILGIMFVLPIGGADMPVVIALLNSFTGLATALTGFVLNNAIMIVGGTLVGASGLILTQLMSKAMNRSITNILFGAFGTIQSDSGSAISGDLTVRRTTVEDLAILCTYAQSVVIVPGYGLAVARAQQEIKEISDLLEERHVNVRYAIHPVAGRMPGHMNVLLAEANVPYTQLVEMDSINPDFPQTDVVIVIGANDVVNPAARTNHASPIYGMPILNVDQAKTVVVLKRSMNPGFAGIDNELFYRPNTMMLFGDAKATLTELVAAIKNVQ